MATSDLSPYLRRTLSLVAEGHSNGAIATRCKITTRSVERYVARLYAIFGGASRYEMIKRAARRGAVRLSNNGIRPRDHAALTSIEQAVAREALRLRTNSEIAHRLGMSAGSVLSSLTIIRRKMRRPTKLAALDRALELGYIKGLSLKVLRTPITRREAAILRRLAQGWSLREIAEDLSLHKSNVTGRVVGLRAKFRVRSNEALLDEVGRLKLLPRGVRATHANRRALEDLRSEPRSVVLTKRQRDVLDAFHRFPMHTHRAIADYFGISKAAIDQYSVALQRHFGARGREDLRKRTRRYVNR